MAQWIINYLRHTYIRTYLYIVYIHTHIYNSLINTTYCINDTLAHIYWGKWRILRGAIKCFRILLAQFFALYLFIHTHMYIIHTYNILLFFSDWLGLLYVYVIVRSGFMPILRFYTFHFCCRLNVCLYTCKYAIFKAAVSRKVYF